MAIATSRVLALLLLPALLLLGASCTEQAPPDSKPAATDEIKTPHWLDSFPMHGETFAVTPRLVKLNFNFDLGRQSSITIEKDGKNVTGGPAVIAKDNLSMEASVTDAGDGTYLVTYKAYWPDGSSHDGQYSFKVDDKTMSGYTDETGKAKVTVLMENLEFVPSKVIVSPGATVTWVNREAATHFINSDAHASHNVLPKFNSRGLAQGASYSYVFDTPGEWGYHCSAHFPKMRGRVIVTEGPPAKAAKPEPKSPLGPSPTSIKHLRTPHFVKSEPAHGVTLAKMPSRIVIYFNFTLDHESSIRLVKRDQKVQTGPTSYAPNSLAMRALVIGDRGPGTYTVKYRAFWPDKSYHDGQFAFGVK
jgi:plastocyanin